MLASRRLLLMGGGSTPLQRLKALFAGGEEGGLWLPDIISGQYQISTPATPVTADGDPLGYSADHTGNGHHLIQATAGNRPTWKDSGGIRYISRLTSTSMSVPSSQAPFKFGHDGSGMTFAMAVRWTGSASGVRPGNAASTAGAGFSLGRDNTNRARLAVGNGSVQVIAISPASPTMDDNTWHVQMGTYSTALGGEAWIDGVSIGTQAEAATPSSGNAASNFTLPITGAGTFDIAAMLLIDRVLSSAERAFVTEQFGRYAGLSL